MCNVIIIITLDITCEITYLDIHYRYYISVVFVLFTFRKFNLLFIAWIFCLMYDENLQILFCIIPKILWLLLDCFQLAVELSVIIFGLWAGMNHQPCGNRYT